MADGTRRVEILIGWKHYKVGSRWLFVEGMARELVRRGIARWVDEKATTIERATEPRRRSERRG